MRHADSSRRSVWGRLEALYLIAIGTGLRQEEILGLASTDIDLVASTLTVRNALQRVKGMLELVERKSATSHRTVALPAFVADGLRTHPTRQRIDRLLAGSRRTDDPWGLVFTTTVGTPMDGIAVTRRSQSVLATASLRRQRFHEVRHAYASLVLAHGVTPRVVMETLGHSQISLTLNTYSHVIPALGRAAAEQMDAMLGPRSIEPHGGHGSDHADTRGASTSPKRMPRARRSIP